MGVVMVAMKLGRRRDQLVLNHKRGAYGRDNICAMHVPSSLSQVATCDPTASRPTAQTRRLQPLATSFGHAGIQANAYSPWSEEPTVAGRRAYPAIR
jgi:hypothetical protein